MPDRTSLFAAACERFQQELLAREAAQGPDADLQEERRRRRPTKGDPVARKLNHASLQLTEILGSSAGDHADQAGAGAVALRHQLHAATALNNSAGSLVSHAEKLSRRSNRASSLFDASETEAEIRGVLNRAQQRLEEARAVMASTILPNVERIRRAPGSSSRFNDHARHWDAAGAELRKRLEAVTQRIMRVVEDLQAREASARAERARLTGVETVSEATTGALGMRQRRQQPLQNATSAGDQAAGVLPPEHVDERTGQTIFIPMPDRGPMGGLQSESLMRQRDEQSNAVRKIEATLSELAGMFGRLGSLVSEQGEVLSRVDSNISDSVYNVDSAQSSLLLFKSKMDQQRALILKTFAVLVVLVCVYVFLR